MKIQMLTAHSHVSDILWLALNYIFLITWYFLQSSYRYFLSSGTRDESVCGKGEFKRPFCSLAVNGFRRTNRSDCAASLKCLSVQTEVVRRGQSVCSSVKNFGVLPVPL